MSYSTFPQPSIYSPTTQESYQLPIHWKRQRQVFLIILKKLLVTLRSMKKRKFQLSAPYIGVVSRRLDAQVLKRSLTVLVERNARAGPAEPPA